MNTMHKHHGVPGGTLVHCVDRAGMARTTTTKGLGIMSKLTVAQLIGETPEMLRACGEAIQYEQTMRHWHAQSQVQTGDTTQSRCIYLADLYRGMYESAMENIARMVASK